MYPTLQRLEDEGLSASESDEGKRVYRVTDAGRRELERLDEEVRHIWRRARRWDDWRAMLDLDAAEIRGPAERLVKAAFRAVAGGFDEARIARVLEILERGPAKNLRARPKGIGSRPLHSQAPACAWQRRRSFAAYPYFLTLQAHARTSGSSICRSNRLKIGTSPESRLFSA